MKFLLGNRQSCSVKSSRRPAPYMVTASYAMSPDGYSIMETSVQKPMSWYNHTRTSYDQISYVLIVNSGST